MICKGCSIELKNCRCRWKAEMKYLFESVFTKMHKELGTKADLESAMNFPMKIRKSFPN